jgi:uncharacterized protein
MQPKQYVQAGIISYSALKGSLSFVITVDKPTEITGSSKLHLRFAVNGDANDADLFVTLQKHDANGKVVFFPYHTFVDEGHVAWGWLRASRRALASQAYGDEVVHTHREEDVQPLVSNEMVDLEINIQPTATLFRSGEKLVLAIQGRDFGEFGPQCQLPRAGTGVNKDVECMIDLDHSYLELPIIPNRK